MDKSRSEQGSARPDLRLGREEEWTTIIRPVSGWFDFRLCELLRYRDLIVLFVRRDFVSIYKQTVLGPLWYLIQPILTTLIFTVVFGKIANIPTDGMPPVLFYLSGVVVWRYFADCLQKTSSTFVSNSHIFGKVYFPRLTVPVSVVLSNLITFVLQLVLFACFWLYFYATGANVELRSAVLVLPLLVVEMAALGLGCGIIVSSLTTKYRDLSQLVGFGVQLLMYLSPVVYPLSIIPDKYRWLVMLNPMVPIIETFRYSCLGVGTVTPVDLLTSMLTTMLVLFVGVVLFTRIEKTFMDSI